MIKRFYSVLIDLCRLYFYRFVHFNSLHFILFLVINLFTPWLIHRLHSEIIIFNIFVRRVQWQYHVNLVPVDYNIWGKFLSLTRFHRCQTTTELWRFPTKVLRSLFCLLGHRCCLNIELLNVFINQSHSAHPVMECLQRR